MDSAEISLWQLLRYTRFRDAIRGRLDASLDWKRALAEAKLPAELADTVSQTVRATRLWRSEKVDIARELIAHFQDGLEQGQTGPALAAKFGDPKQTAQLIRRAKERGRPLTWHVWHYGWMTLAGLILLYVLTGLYMMTDRPTIKINYLAIINKEAQRVPVAERAWPLYRNALLSMRAKAVPGNFDPASTIPNVDARPGDANWPKLEQLLRDHADAVAKLREAAGRANLGFLPANSDAAFTLEDRQLFGVTVTQEQIDAFKSETVADHWLIGTLLPHLQHLRTVAMLLSADVQRAAGVGDAKTSMDDVVAICGVSRHAQETPFLVNLLVANAVQAMGYDAIRDILADHPQLWSDGELRDLAHRVAASRIDWKRGFAGETACFYDTMQRLYTDDGHGDGRLAFRSSAQENIFELLNSITGPAAQSAASYYANDGLAMLMLPAANMVVASRQNMTKAYESFVNSAMTKISTPLWDQQTLLLPDEELLSDKAGPIDRYRYMFVRLLVPAYDTLRNKIVNANGERDGVFVGIALELYHREHKAWPKTLGELSPRWLPTVPVDQITGEPLHYKIVDDRPVVYSVGVDRDDDSGRVPAGDEGKPDADLASPNHFQLQPATDKTHDGDWVIWSTAKRN